MKCEIIYHWDDKAGFRYKCIDNTSTIKDIIDYLEGWLLGWGDYILIHNNIQMECNDDLIIGKYGIEENNKIIHVYKKSKYYELTTKPCFLKSFKKF